MNEPSDILLIDDELGVPNSTFEAKYGVLEEKRADPFRFHYSTAQDGGTYSAEAALHAVRAIEKLDAILLDIKFERDDCRFGLEILEKIRDEYPLLPIVMLTSLDKDIPALEKSMELGANDYVVKLPPVKELERTLNRYTRPGGEDADYTIWGDAPPIREMRARIARIAAGQLSALICGETGTGKELVAQTIHRLGPRRNRPFIPKNCAHADSSLIETEFFGQEEGSFTNAVTRAGLVEQANGGILFLDEIATIPIALQGQLLRLLENREYKPVGASTHRRADIQILCATNKNLSKLVTEGKIREDFYYRINGQQLDVPPLRERRSDIGVLAQKLLIRFRHKVGEVFPATRLSEKATTFLQECDYNWPGNVRMLNNLVETCVAASTSNTIELDEVVSHIAGRGSSHIGKRNASDESSQSITIPDEGLDLPTLLAKQELLFIREALRKTEGNKTAAVRLLYPNKQGNQFRRAIHECLIRYPDGLEEFPEFCEDYRAEVETRKKNSKRNS